MNIKSFRYLSEHLKEMLRTENYSVSTIRDMDFIINSFSSFMEEIECDDYSPEIGEQFLDYCKSDLKICPSRITRASGIVRKLNRLYHGLDGKNALWGSQRAELSLPQELQMALDDYLRYCKSNGNKQTTILYKQWICGRFLKELSNRSCEKGSEITAELIQSAFLSLGFPRYWERIGPFLRFLFETGFANYDYSMLINYRKHNTPHPTVYSTDEIQSVEKSINRNTAAGIRNYAIFLLISRYGIRSSDIAALGFDNVDFNNDRISFVQQKTGNTWEAELFPEVKEALINYIQLVRPLVDGCSKIFMTLVIPHKPIDYRVINTMVGDLVKKSEVPILERHHGSRAFRSSMASNMINDNVSTEIVRRILGHGTKYAIRHYARIDIKNLKLCALEVPLPSGNFARLLNWKEGEANV